jgi:hypothetical protein
MTHGFQQQNDGVNFTFPKAAPQAQHGRKPDAKTAQPSKPQRAFEPRPGH